jgi:16S rRNA (guanine966-N2)-methyltransferase
MRIISGKFKSRMIIAPSGTITRPTTDRARESLFNVLNNLISFEDSLVLDLFAGSGALGLEALSRGAKRATFVERDRKAVAVIRSNSAELGVSPVAEIVALDVYTYIAIARPIPQGFDIVFADAPYDDIRALNQLSLLIANSELLAPDGLCAIEHRTGDTLVLPKEAKIIRELNAGEASFTIFHNKK